MRKKIFDNCTSDKYLQSRVKKELSRLSNKKINHLIKRDKRYEHIFHQRKDIHEGCSTSLVIREVQFETTSRGPYTLIRMTKILKTGVLDLALLHTYYNK